MLGAVPGAVNAGELNAVFSRVSTQDQLCGCGEPFSQCAYWGAVGDRAFGAFGGWSQVTEQMSYLQPRVVRQRFVPAMASGVSGATYRSDLHAYLENYRLLYQAIASVSGAEVVVDASKSTAQLFGLQRIAGLDLRVLNLVRDSRGVANSWSKAGIAKPQSVDGDLMGTYSPRRLAVLWSALQLEAEVLNAKATHSARVRYEDLVAAPRPTLAKALAEVGLPVGANDLDHVKDNSVHLTPSHGVAGSRTRFTSGRIELTLDDAWRAALPTPARRVVTALTFPQLLSYGYVGPRARSARST